MAQIPNKIALLPERIRNIITIHLENREDTQKVADWLNDFQPVQAIMCQDSIHAKITVEDLEDWRKIAECASQNAGERAAQKTAEPAAQKPNDLATLCAAAVANANRIAATGVKADTLLLLLNARLAVLLHSGDNAPQTAAGLGAFRTLLDAVVRLHQCETRSARLALDRERLAFEQEKLRVKVESERRGIGKEEGAPGVGEESGVRTESGARGGDSVGTGGAEGANCGFVQGSGGVPGEVSNAMVPGSVGTPCVPAAAAASC